MGRVSISVGFYGTPTINVGSFTLMTTGTPRPQIILATGIDPYIQKKYSGLLNSVILGYFWQLRLGFGNLG